MPAELSYLIFHVFYLEFKHFTTGHEVEYFTTGGLIDNTSFTGIPDCSKERSCLLITRERCRSLVTCHGRRVLVARQGAPLSCDDLSGVLIRYLLVTCQGHQSLVTWYKGHVPSRVACRGMPIADDMSNVLRLVQKLN